MAPPSPFHFQRCKGKGPPNPLEQHPEGTGMSSSSQGECTSPLSSMRGTRDVEAPKEHPILCLALVNRDDWSLTRGPPAQRSWYPAPARELASQKCLCEQSCHYPLCLGTLAPGFFKMFSLTFAHHCVSLWGCSMQGCPDGQAG